MRVHVMEFEAAGGVVDAGLAAVVGDAGALGSNAVMGCPPSTVVKLGLPSLLAADPTPPAREPLAPPPVPPLPPANASAGESPAA